MQYSTNGSLPFPRKFSQGHWEQENAIRDVESDGVSRKVLILEPVERENGEYDFRTLRAIEHSHALVYGGFGESSTDKTLPKTKRSTKKRKAKKKVEETEITNNNDATVIFVRDPRKSKGSIKSVDSVKRKSLGPTSEQVVHGTIDGNTVSSKAGVAYVLYENEDIKIACNSHRNSPNGSLSPSVTLDTGNAGDDYVDSKSIGSADLDRRSCDSRDERAIEEWKDMIQKEFDKTLHDTNPQDDLVDANNEHLFVYDNKALAVSTPSLSGAVQSESTIEPPSEFKDASIQGSVPNLSSTLALAVEDKQQQQMPEEDETASLPSEPSQTSETDSETGPLVKPEPKEEEQQYPEKQTNVSSHLKRLPDGPITAAGVVNSAFDLGERTDSQWSMNDNTMSSTASSANVAVVQPQRLSVKNLMSRFEDKPVDKTSSYNSLPNPKKKMRNSWQRDNSVENLNELPSEPKYGTLKPASKSNSSDPENLPSGHNVNQGSFKFNNQSTKPHNKGNVKSEPEIMVITRDKNNFLWNEYDQGEKPSAHVQPQIQESHADVRL